MIGEPVFTSVVSSIKELNPLPGSLYIGGSSAEDRSRHVSVWEGHADVTFARVVSDDGSRAVVEMDDETLDVGLRSAEDIRGVLQSDRYACVYLDITGLEHHVWAPFLKGIRVTGVRAFCVYVEPGDYRFSSAPTEGTIFDLSESIRGIGPLPGFLSLSGGSEEEALFVPLLGFEGARFAHMLEAVQPGTDRVHPVIGVPGFRPEYPFYAYLGNRLPLMDTGAWQYVRFAPANCPFALYHLLVDVSCLSPGRLLRIAPIGTKPHALGAMLYYLDHSATTEIIYDHPIRNDRRTIGVSRTCIYDLGLLPTVRPDRSIDVRK